MLRNLDKEFRGNGLPDQLYSRLIRNRAVMHMKNTCSPVPDDVMRITGDPGLLSAVPGPPASRASAPGRGPGAVRGARRHLQCEMNDR